MKSEKGSVLIVVVMITLMMLIISIGLYTIVNSNVNTTMRTVKRNRLYHAAEAGFTYADKYLKNIDALDLMDPAKSNVIMSNFTGGSSEKTIVLNDITISTTIGTDLNLGFHWDIVSKASYTNGDLNGAKCVISMNNLLLTSTLQYCNFAIAGMAAGGYYNSDYSWFGKVYYNGIFNIRRENGDGPTFYGAVDSHSNIHSYLSSGTNHYTDNILDVYDHGLRDYTSEDQTPLEIRDDLNGMYLNGYNKNHDQVALNEISRSWAEIVAGTKTKLLSSSDNDDIYIRISNNLNNNMVTINKLNGSGTLDIIDTLDMSSANILAIGKDYGSNIHILGEVAQDFTLVTEEQNIFIDGDFYATDYAIYKNLDPGLPDADLENKVNEMMAVSSDTEVGLISGLALTNGDNNNLNKGNYYFTKNTFDGSGSGSDIIYITAGMYAPHGMLISEDHNDWNYHSKALIYGSMINQSEGVTESTNGKGLSMLYASDYKFLRGYRPPGYNNSQTIDPYTISAGYIGNYENVFSDIRKWSLSWE